MGLFSTAAIRPIVFLPQQVPAFISRGATHHTDERDLYQRRRELLPMKFASKSVIHERTRFFYMPQSWDMGHILLLPLRRKAYWGFSGRPKNPTRTRVPLASMLTTRPPNPSWSTLKIWSTHEDNFILGKPSAWSKHVHVPRFFRLTLVELLQRKYSAVVSRLVRTEGRQLSSRKSEDPVPSSAGPRGPWAHENRQNALTQILMQPTRTDARSILQCGQRSHWEGWNSPLYPPLLSESPLLRRLLYVRWTPRLSIPLAWNY